jgi:hypothetical protein
MTIHDKIAAVVKPFVGKTLSTRHVQALLQEKYPGTNPTSVIPSDHSGPNLRSGRSYCNCSGNPSQIFAHDQGGYKVLDGTATPLGRAPRSTASMADGKAILRNSQNKVVIDDAFIREWDPKYDRTENDENEYRRLVTTVAADMVSTKSISQGTFRAIWDWKGATRVIRHVRFEEYDTLYAPAFRRAASEPPQRKLAVLLGPGVKLPGVEAATGSTIIHLMHPQSMPIMDVRTISVLFRAGLITTQQKDLAHYEEFRQTIEGIRRTCPGWSLRQIDRALFAYHKQFLDKVEAGRCQLVS